MWECTRRRPRRPASPYASTAFGSHRSRAAEGLLKATIDAKSDRILGCTLFCPESGEAINTVALAMKHGITARELSGSVYTHPSMSESLNDLFA